MTAAGGEYGTWGHGGAAFPLDDETPADRSFLALADPAVAAMSDFLAAVIELQMGDALRAYADRAGQKITPSIQSTSNVEPAPSLYGQRTKYPFFALYRKSETEAQHTIAWNKSVAELEFVYVLPILVPRAQESLVPALRAVVRIIGKALKVGCHPGYQSGAEVLKSAGVMSCRLVSARYERYDRGEQTEAAPQFFRGVVGSIELVERETPVAGAFETFTGAIVHVHAAPTDGGPVYDDVVIVEALPAPTITSVTPNSGPMTGGTSVTIGGSYYRAPMTLTIGGVKVPATVTSTTTATAVTPAQSATATFMADVIATRDVDGRCARAPAAFTFTTP